jgi:hypothetical protein
MKCIILFIFLFASAIYAQDIDTIESPVMKAYNDFVNYTPKALEHQPIPSEFGEWRVENLITAWLLYGYKDSRSLTDGQLSWLTGRINGLAVAFYLEGSPVLLRSTGGYDGCPESEFELKKELLNGREVTVVNFCHSCTGRPKGEDEFIKIFNNRTERLLEGSR